MSDRQVVAGDQRTVLVTNAASDEVSGFTIHEDGLELGSRTSVGTAPKTVAEHEGSVRSSRPPSRPSRC